jgi:hypothetical protein
MCLYGVHQAFDLARREVFPGPYSQKPRQKEGHDVPCRLSFAQPGPSRSSQKEGLITTARRRQPLRASVVVPGLGVSGRPAAAQARAAGRAMLQGEVDRERATGDRRWVIAGHCRRAGGSRHSCSCRC